MNMNKTTLYYMWLGTACGFEPKLMDLCFCSIAYSEDTVISDTYKTDKYIEKIFENRFEIQNKIDKSEYKGKINLHTPLDEATKIYEDCLTQGINIITIGSKDYPDRLRNIYCPPKALFVKGNISGVDDTLGISIVGTRQSTKSGLEISEKIAFELAQKGVIISSGMAMGIDSAAHMGAIAAGGRTFATLAGGVDVVYPAVNRDIYNLICETGAVISERPPHTIGKPYFYQQRNRIITGLSLGVLIVEGAQNSGTAITARLALENNRDVFAVPGNINMIQSQLPNKLIQDGAILVRNSSDILKQYKYLYPDIKVDSKKGNYAEKPNRFRFKDIFDKIVKNSKFKTEKSKSSKVNVQNSADEPESISANDNFDTDGNNNTNEKQLIRFYESEKFLTLGEDDKKIIKYIGENTESGVTADDITEIFEIEPNELNSKLMLWQVDGIITQTSGSRLYLVHD